MAASVEPQTWFLEAIIGAHLLKSVYLCSSYLIMPILFVIQVNIRSRYNNYCLVLFGKRAKGDFDMGIVFGAGSARLVYWSGYGLTDE